MVAKLAPPLQQARGSSFPRRRGENQTRGQVTRANCRNGRATHADRQPGRRARPRSPAEACKLAMSNFPRTRRQGIRSADWQCLTSLAFVVRTLPICAPSLLVRRERGILTLADCTPRTRTLPICVPRALLRHARRNFDIANLHPSLRKSAWAPPSAKTSVFLICCRGGRQKAKSLLLGRQEPGEGRWSRESLASKRGEMETRAV